MTKPQFLVLMLAVCAAIGGCAKRFTNTYRTDLQGKMISAAGNDTKLVRAVKVRVLEVREGTQIVLFENVSDKPVSFDYRVRWYNTFKLPATDYSPWTRLTLPPQGQQQKPIAQPRGIKDLAALEILVRPPPG